ncbi:MAG: DUF4124 domain-containing protein [Gallionella sp.]|jgi:hypothetical protein
MKLGILLWCFVPALALADIYKAVDADGHVTYSSAPLKGGKRVVVSQPATPSVAQPPSERARTTATPQDFPKVNQETQRGRDTTRRKILEDELRAEEDLLGVARQGQQASEANRHVAKDGEKVKALAVQVELHQRNIDALKTELSKLK